MKEQTGRLRKGRPSVAGQFTAQFYLEDELKGLIFMTEAIKTTTVAST